MGLVDLLVKGTKVEGKSFRIRAGLRSMAGMATDGIFFGDIPYLLVFKITYEGEGRFSISNGKWDIGSIWPNDGNVAVGFMPSNDYREYEPDSNIAKYLKRMEEKVSTSDSPIALR